MGRMLTEAGDMPSRTGDIRANARLLDTPFMTPYVQELSHAMPFPLVLGGAQLTTDLQKQIEAMEYGTQTIAQTMSRAQQQATSLLKQYYH